MVNAETFTIPDRDLTFLVIRKLSNFLLFLILLFSSKIWYAFNSSTLVGILILNFFAILLLAASKSATLSIRDFNSSLIIGLNNEELNMKKDLAKKIFRETRKDYNVISDQFSRAREKIWEEMKFLADDYLIEGEKVLDLGCGNGRFYELLNKGDYIGVDSSEELIKIARKRYPKVKFQVADALNLPFPDNYFDKVYAIAVFHHIPSKELREKFLSEIKRVLKPEGFMIITVWNLWQKERTKKIIFKSLIDKFLKRTGLDFKDILMRWEGKEGFYFHAFTKGELKQLIKGAGFKIEDKGEILVNKAKKKKWPNSNLYIIAKKP